MLQLQLNACLVVAYVLYNVVCMQLSFARLGRFKILSTTFISRDVRVISSMTMTLTAPNSTFPVSATALLSTHLKQGINTSRHVHHASSSLRDPHYWERHLAVSSAVVFAHIPGKIHPDRRKYSARLWSE